MDEESKMNKRIKLAKKVKWYVLEWNALDNGIELYAWESDKTDVAEVWEEVGEGLHNYASVLVMDEGRLQNLVRAVESLKGGNVEQ